MRPVNVGGKLSYQEWLALADIKEPTVVTYAWACGCPIGKPHQEWCIHSSGWIKGKR